MNKFLVFAYLYFIGSCIGWDLEVLFRKFFSKSNPEHKWINPGFCQGPYLPMYGFGLCVLYQIACFAEQYGFKPWITVVIITSCMTVLEYITGILMLKVFKIRLWDYRHLWGNIQGLICPLFTLIWGILGSFYFYVINPVILDSLKWLSRNLAFSFIIGFFFGVFSLDIAHSTNIASKLKKIAKEHNIVIILYNAKAMIRKFNEEHHLKHHFLRPFKSDFNISEILVEKLKGIIQKH